MEQSCIVTSPFKENQVELFYQASLNRSNSTLVLKIFNHRGTLKNRRLIQLPSSVSHIFTAQQYLIGLDQKHQRVWIIDVRRSRNNSASSQITQTNGLSKQLKEKGLKFSSFFYDKDSNLIYGLYGGHYLFYFRINYFLDDSFSGKNQRDQIKLAQANMSISINKIIQSSKPIDKLQIRKGWLNVGEQQIKKSNIKAANQSLKQVQKQSPSKKQFKNNKTQKSAIIEIVEENKQQQKQLQFNQNIYRQNQQNYQQQSNQKPTIICLLIKQNSTLRMIEIDWEKDQIKSIKQLKQVHDFCFTDHWDVVIYESKSQKKKKQQKKQELTLCLIKTQCNGSYEHNILLSREYVMFTSQQNFFLIQPVTQTIIGVYNKSWQNIQNCQSIPRSISQKNTLLMVGRMDELYLRFTFSVFDSQRGEFINKKILTPIYDITEGTLLQLYLKKNIEKIYTKNAFIHEFFREKIEKCLSAILKQENNQHLSNSFSFRSQETNMKRQSMKQDQIMKLYKQFLQPKNYQKETKSKSKFSASQLGRLFLQKFVMSPQQNEGLFDRLIYSLINVYGLKGLFGDKKYSRDQQNQGIFFQEKNEISRTSEIIAAGHLQEGKEFNGLIKRCVFTRWNGYFQQIVNQQYITLKELFIENGMSQRQSQKRNDLVPRNEDNVNSSLVPQQQQRNLNSSLYSNSVEDKFSQLYQNLHSIKQKLAMISVAYHRFLNLIQTKGAKYTNRKENISQRDSNYQDNNQINDANIFTSTLLYFKSKIKQNINKIHSLYLIFDIFELARKKNSRIQPCNQLLEKIESAVRKIWKQFDNQRNLHVFKYKKQKMILGEKPIKISQYLRKNKNYDNKNNQNFSLIQQDEPSNLDILPPYLMLHEYFPHGYMLAIGSDKITFQILLNYLLKNVDLFEEVAYFYHILRQNILNKDQKLQQQNHQNQQSEKGLMRQYKSQEQEKQIKVDNNNNGKQSLQISTYPYINRNLINLFYLLQSIPINYGHYIQENELSGSQQKEELDSIRRKINQAVKLAMLIESRPIINFIMQLCALYRMPLDLVKLVQSLKLTDEEFFYQQAQLFLYNETHIMRCMLYCAFYPVTKNQFSGQKSQQTLTTVRQILLYQMKHLLKINLTIDNLLNKRPTQRTQQQLLNIKTTLLQQFAVTVLRNSQCQSIRHLQEVKNQCILSKEEKDHFQKTINHVVNLHNKNQQNLPQSLHEIK